MGHPRTFQSDRRLALKALPLGLALASAALARPAWAQKAGTPLTPAEREAKGRNYFTNVQLVAQDGRPMRFYDDVLKGRLVLVNFVFTECGDACPLITALLLQTRQLLGAQASEARFVSITVDPERETPQTMAAFAKKHSAVDPEWLWLSGSKANIEQVTKRLGAYTDTRETHFTGLLVGNLRTDRWVKMRPDAPPQLIAEQLRRVGELDAKSGAAPAAAVSAGKLP